MCEVNLIKKGNEVYIWNVEDWSKIRKYRVYGKLIGTLAALPRQDIVHGFPFALLPDETTLLLSKGFAKLVDYSNLAEEPSNGVAQKCTTSREENLQGQVKLLKDERKKEIESKIEDIMRGKKRKLISLGRKEEAEKLNQSDVLEEEIRKIQDPQPGYLGIQIFTDDPWISDEQIQMPEWQYPQSLFEKLKYATFKDLWERQLHVTGGGKFGAHFLAYPGDPSKYHSWYIIVCQDPNKKMRPSDIVAYGRLAQSVRKTVVLAYLQHNEVGYQSVQWMGQ